MTGPGSALLSKALTGANFVLIGEDHGMAEVPLFVEGVWKLCTPLGFDTMAVESGPLAVDELRTALDSQQGRAYVASIEKQCPYCIAFYNLEQEFDLLARCAVAVPKGRFRLWGLDQEFLGSARLILARMLKTKLSPGAQALVKEHLEANDRAYQKAVQTGSSRDLYLFALSDAHLDELKKCLDREGNPAAQSLMSSLLKTRSIYRKMFAAQVYDSNRERSRLFKTTFEREYTAATRAGGRAPKVLFKFGLLHAFKGFNLLNNNDLGNHIAELAEGQSSTSLHIAVVPVKATRLRVTAIGKPYEPAAVDYSGEDSPLGFLKPLYENLDGGQWTLFDLRPLRANVRSLGTVTADLKRFIFGYDLVVVYREGTPSRQIQ